MRFEPPVHFRTRTTLAAIDVAGTRIPQGLPRVLFVASGNRDPKRFAHPDRSDPDRADNPHFGIGGGPHYRVDAPLEAESALAALAKRIVNPRLLEDLPPCRARASPRKPERLMRGIMGAVA